MGIRASKRNIPDFNMVTLTLAELLATGETVLNSGVCDVTDSAYDVYLVLNRRTGQLDIYGR